MIHKSFWCGVLIGVISLALAKPIRAESYQTAGKQVVAGIVVVSVGIGVLVTVLSFAIIPSRTRLPAALIPGRRA